MTAQFEDSAADTPQHGEPIREIEPWREVGWIFRDGSALAIERQDDRTRTRSARFSHLGEE